MVSQTIAAPVKKSRLGAILKALVISLAKSGVLILLSLLAGMVHPILGALVLFGGSLYMLMGQYKKPWRLNWLTGLCPPVMAMLSIVIQLLFFANIAPLPTPILILAMLGIGGLLGLWRGLVHRVWHGEKGLMAERTTMYLMVWAACFLFTQILGMLKLSGLLPYGLLTNFFSVSMLMMVSTILVIKGLFAKPPADEQSPSNEGGATA